MVQTLFGLYLPGMIPHICRSASTNDNGSSSNSRTTQPYAWTKVATVRGSTWQPRTPGTEEVGGCAGIVVIVDGANKESMFTTKGPKCSALKTVSASMPPLMIIQLSTYSRI